MAKTCGESYRNQPLCCDANQVQTQLDAMKIAYNLVSACPACWENFRRFFCDFTCSANQSTFVNVTQVKTSYITNKSVVAEVDLYVEPEFGRGFFKSCKDVKFPADNSFVMKLLGKLRLESARHCSGLFMTFGLLSSYLASLCEFDPDFCLHSNQVVEQPIISRCYLSWAKSKREAHHSKSTFQIQQTGRLA